MTESADGSFAAPPTCAKVAADRQRRRKAQVVSPGGTVLHQGIAMTGGGRIQVAAVDGAGAPAPAARQ